MRVDAVLLTLVTVALAPACADGDDEAVSQAKRPATTLAVPRANTAPSPVDAGRAGGRTTVSCSFADLVGIVVVPETRRVEIVETNQEFAGDTGLPPTGEGKIIAELTPTGLTVGGRCRSTRAPRRNDAANDTIGPYPETYPTWLRCALSGAVSIDAVPFRGGYRLSVGVPPYATIRATLLPDRRGSISFSQASCRRFVVTDNPIP